ncbi:long-chain fatty acid--CoA ligase [Micromonospora sp. KC213]|uniref:acyl-CoA synthetase n=1 Tax=Micromonospora sp. KC213 TaxID=2530378 RepID=UPI00104C505F|nr:long-chain fatty acid--CoA ligase [Micromonospora sp. KC213]TDC40311.1 long-chain-fatty-acid--CoA ligase [Micromonospora sp. KC213]
MRNQGIGSWTARRDRKTPHRVAVVHQDREWTYRQLHERVLRLAHGLRALGVTRGDRVAYLGPNHPAFLETLFAAGTLGAVFVPLNTRLAGPEIADHLADSDSRVLVYAPEQAAVVDAMRERLTVAHLVALADDYEPLLARSSAEPVDEPVSLADPCIIMYTSGTTGRAKGAMLTHGNITWNSINVLVDADLAGDEVTLVVAPLFHTAGLNMTCLPTLLKGGRVLLEPVFDPERTLDLIAARQVTFMFAVPAMFNTLASLPRWPSADLSSLRTLMCGGAPVPDATIRAYLARGLTFIQGYGMTEAAPGVLLLDRSEVLAKAGSAGVPHFFTDVRVVRPDLTDCPPGEKGEVIVQGPNVMAGYWGQPEATARAFAEGDWFRSGDVAVTDDDRYAYIVDRIKDMIISGGENIYPAEVENVLVSHPAVAEAALIGVPDEKWGEVGLAFVVLHPGAQAGEEDLHGYLHGRIAKYKIPKSFRFVDELPRNATGKLLKSRLRETHVKDKEGP